MARSVMEILENRLLNPDAAGLVAERLDQATLIRLAEWFVDEAGGNGGSTLVMRAPIFDALIQRCVDAVSGGRNSPRGVSIALFGSGLGVGAHWLAQQDGDGPFPTQGDLAEMQTSLEGFSLSESALRDRGEMDSAAESADCDPQALMQPLCALDPRIEWIVQAVFRMAIEIMASDFGLPRRPGLLAQSPVSRLLFFAGMVGGGLLVPAVGSRLVGEEQDDVSEGGIADQAA